VIRLFLPIFACLLLRGTVASEPYSFSASVDRDSISVGDPIHLILSLELPSNATPTVVPEIGMPESFRILGNPDAVREDLGEGRTRWTQSIKLTSFRPGETEIPEIRLKISETPGDTTVLSDDPITILVQSIKPDDLTDIVDVKHPVSIEAEIPAWAWLFLIPFVLPIGFWVWWRNRSKGSAPEPVAVVVNWFDEVRKLCNSGLIEKGEFDAYYTRLSEALRRFIEQRSGVEAMERTTYEIRNDLARAEMTEAHILGVEGFLNEADLVKFAKFEPNKTRAVEDGDRVLILMTGLDKTYRDRERQAALLERSEGATT
jgi:hypothetical protein